MVQKCSRKLNNTSGFTLVELMVGIGVSVAAMLATATSVTHSLQASKKNNLRTQASLTQVQIMNDLYNKVHEGLTSNTANGIMSKKSCTRIFGGDMSGDDPDFTAIQTKLLEANSRPNKNTDVKFLKQFAGYKVGQDISLDESTAIQINSIQFEVIEKNDFSMPVCKASNDNKNNCNDWSAGARSSDAIDDKSFTHIFGTVHIAMSEKFCKDSDTACKENAETRRGKTATALPALQIPLHLYFNSDDKMVSCSHFRNLQACQNMGKQQGMLIEGTGGDYRCDTRHAINQAMHGCVQGKMFQRVNNDCRTAGNCTCPTNFEPIKMTSINHKGYRTELYQCLKCFNQKGDGYGFENDDSGNNKNPLNRTPTSSRKEYGRNTQTHLDLEAVKDITRYCDKMCRGIHKDSSLMAPTWKHSSGVKCCALNNDCSHPEGADTSETSAYGKLLRRIKATDDRASCCRQACHCREHSSLCENNWLNQGEGGRDGDKWLSGCDDTNASSLICLMTGSNSLCPVSHPKTIGTGKIPKQEHIEPDTASPGAPATVGYPTGWRKASDQFKCTAEQSAGHKIMGFLGSAISKGIEVYAPIKATRVPSSVACDGNKETSKYFYSNERHSYGVATISSKQRALYINNTYPTGTHYPSGGYSGIADCADDNSNTSDDCDNHLHYQDPATFSTGAETANCVCQHYRTNTWDGSNGAKSKLTTSNEVYTALEARLQSIIDKANDDNDDLDVPSVSAVSHSSTSRSGYDGEKSPCLDAPHSHGGKDYLDFCGDYTINGANLRKTAATCSDLRYTMCKAIRSHEDEITASGTCTEEDTDNCLNVSSCPASSCGCEAGQEGVDSNNNPTCGQYKRCQDLDVCGCDQYGRTSIRCTNKPYIYHTLTDVKSDHVNRCRDVCNARNTYINDNWGKVSSPSSDFLASSYGGSNFDRSSKSEDIGWENETKLYCKGKEQNTPSTTPPGNAWNPLWREEFICKGVSSALMGSENRNLFDDDPAHPARKGKEAGNAPQGNSDSLATCCAWNAAKHEGNVKRGSGQSEYYYLGPTGKLIGNTPASKDGVLQVHEETGPPLKHTTKPHACFKSLPSRIDSSSPHTQND